MTTEGPDSLPESCTQTAFTPLAQRSGATAAPSASTPYKSRKSRASGFSPMSEAPYTTKTNPKAWAKVQKEVAQLKNTSPANSSAAFTTDSGDDAVGRGNSAN